MNFNISIVRNTHDNYPYDVSLIYPQLVEKLTTFSDEIKPKQKSDGFVAGHFQKKQRLTPNLLSRTLITLDLDHCDSDLTRLESILKRDLKGQWYIAYSTASHTLEKPKIRVVILLKKDIPTENYRRVVMNFVNNLWLRPFLDEHASFTANHFMFFPIRPNKEYIPWCLVQEGELLDPDNHMVEYEEWNVNNDEIDDIKKHKNKLIDKGIDPMLITLQNQPLQISIEQIKSTLRIYKAENTNYNTWLEVGMALAHQFRGDKEGAKLWFNWSKLDPRYKEADIKKQILEKWGSFGELKNPIRFATIMKKTQDAKVINFNSSVTVKNPLQININRNKFLHVTGEKKRPLFTIENFRTILDEYKISINSDVILKKKEITFNNIIENDLNIAQPRIESLCIQNGMTNISVGKYIEVCKTETNSWREWIESKPWDGIDRLNDFCATVKVSEELESIKKTYLKTWLMQMIHLSCLNDGEMGKMGRMVLVFQGDQRIGKTSWFKALCPSTHQKYLKEGMMLDTKDSMSVLACIQNVFVELGELGSTFKKSDSDNLKNFISSTNDVVNIKYVANHVVHRRRTVFFASINDRTFLQDTTGNTRYCILPVTNCNHLHKLDMQQLYAQLYQYAKDGEGYELDTSFWESQKTLNAEFENPSFLKEKFYATFNTEAESRNLAIGTHSILEVLGFTANSIRPAHMSEMARILTDLGYKKRTRHPRSWLLPPQRS